jgi:TonB family protein
MSGQSLRNDEPARNDRHTRVTWDQALALHLVRFAARNAPPGLTERLEEEWLADLMGRRGTLSRIRFGLGCCWATRVIAREFGVASAAAANSASGQPLLVADGGWDFSWFTRRTGAVIAIVFLHAAVFYAYLSGLTPKIVDQPAPPMSGAVITEHRPPHDSKPLPPPTLARTSLATLPPPLFPLNLPADPKTIAVPHDLPLPVPTTPLQAAKPADRIVGGPGAGFPNTGDYYPPMARRLGEAGATAVQVCVGPNGRLTANPAIVQSSGITQLDEGALRLAKAGSGHYRPTTENGRPVSSCYAFRVRFRLEDEWAQ